MVTIYLPSYLQAFSRGESSVTLPNHPPTVREALAALAATYPGVTDRVLDEQGRLRQHVNIFVGPESIRYTGGLDTPLPDPSDLSIIPAVSGGRDGI